jgi:hypothetical protein
MPPVRIPPVEEARDIFRDLGYTVDGDGPTLHAERKWRTVEVTAVADAEPCPITDGGRDDVRLRCFVTWDDTVAELRNRISRVDPDYEWAIIGVTDDDYDVVHGDDIAA